MTEVMLPRGESDRVPEDSPATASSDLLELAKTSLSRPVPKTGALPYVLQVVACGVTFDVPVTGNTRSASVLREVAELAIPSECSKSLGSIEAVLFYNNTPLPPDAPMSNVPRDAVLHLHIRLESFSSLCQIVSSKGAQRRSVFPQQAASQLAPYGASHDRAMSRSVFGNSFPIKGTYSPSSGSGGISERGSVSPNRDFVLENQDSPSWGTPGCTYVAIQSTRDSSHATAPQTRGLVAPGYRAMSMSSGEPNSLERAEYLTVYVQMPPSQESQGVHLSTLSSPSMLQEDDIPSVGGDNESSVISLNQGPVRRLRVRQDFPVGVLRQLFAVEEFQKIFMDGELVSDESRTLADIYAPQYAVFSFAKSEKDVVPLDAKIAESIAKKRKRQERVLSLSPDMLTDAKQSPRTSSAFSPTVRDVNTTAPFDRVDSAASLRSEGSNYSVRRRRSRASADVEEVVQNDVILVENNAAPAEFQLQQTRSVDPYAPVQLMVNLKTDASAEKLESMEPLSKIPMFASPEGSPSPDASSPSPNSSAERAANEVFPLPARRNSEPQFSNVQLSGRNDSSMKISPIKKENSGLSVDPLHTQGLQNASVPRLTSEQSSSDKPPRRSSADAVSSTLRRVVSGSKSDQPSKKKKKSDKSQGLPPISSSTKNPKSSKRDTPATADAQKEKAVPHEPTDSKSSNSNSRANTPLSSTASPQALASVGEQKRGKLSFGAPPSDPRTPDSAVYMSNPGSLMAPLSSHGSPYSRPTSLFGHPSGVKSSNQSSNQQWAKSSSATPNYSFGAGDSGDVVETAKEEAMQRLNSAGTHETVSSESKIRITVRDPVDLAVFNYNVPVVPHCPVGILRQWLSEDLENRMKKEEVPPLLDEKKFGIFYGHTPKYIKDEEATFESITKGVHDVLFQILQMNE
ncbi:proteophosphoglycan ppg4 [Angomonas deanei]|uniref:Uncharacterized protein n=1 Tax=Angomonas deanei TaxID=59799 RepID=A0A7G2CH66_9TRYP|nr:proteophosphoglycan ppg4 [Angomonas deanei]CAD2219096.1 hypothetical protein, conserved [Angomonas deanei]|eukprot:EPY16051.1 proteophosphoglycan ppg4 [Angomonas deanei]